MQSAQELALIVSGKQSLKIGGTFGNRFEKSYFLENELFHPLQSIKINI
jgi:hypothetical protein